MRLLFASDFQLGGGAAYGTPERSRLADQAEGLEAIRELIVARGVSRVIFAGDAFQHRRPAVDELVLFRAWLASLDTVHAVHLIAGNHDVRGPHDLTTLELFRSADVTVETMPRVLELEGFDGAGDVMLGVLPWAHPGIFRSKLTNPTPLELAESLLKIAEGLSHAALARNPEATKLLVTHHALSGMSLPTGASVEAMLGEVVLDVESLLAQGWAAVVAGHVHKHEVAFGEHEGVAVSIGSPWIQDFGEAEGAHGVIIFDTEGDVFEHVEIPGRRFVTIDVDLRGWRVGTWDFASLEGDLRELEGAVVRVRLACTEEAAARLDTAVLRRQLLAAGVHRVHEIRLDVERTVRARAEGMTEDSEPLAALEAWLSAVSEPDDEAERLRVFTRTLLAGVST